MINPQPEYQTDKEPWYPIYKKKMQGHQAGYVYIRADRTPNTAFLVN